MSDPGMIEEKCRRCGKTFADTHVPSIGIAMAQLATSGRVTAWGGTPCSIVGTHWCGDGGLGIADVIGARLDSSEQEPEKKEGAGAGALLASGLYRIRWADGGSSVAAVGVTSNGGRWLAPTNWIAPADPFERWDMIASAERLDLEPPCGT